MCGITGIINFNLREVTKDQIQKINDSIAHRGPDGEGFYIKGNFAFGHRRLSIIDINTGKQPVFNDREDIVITFNGEIFNYIELRDELKKFGHCFLTQSDTEVIIKSYEQWGVECLNKFNGMWSFVLYDSIKKIFFGSRDRLGIKPFYYLTNKDRFVFASEIKAFYQIDSFNKEIDRSVVWDHLVFGAKPYGATYIKEVNELEAGSYFLIKDNKIQFKQYYNLENTFENQTDKVDYAKIEYLLNDSIKLRLRSDVPIATLNSGGLDSSLISAIVKQQKNDLKTYSIAPCKGANGETLPGDESKFAEYIAAHIKSDHKTLRYSSEEFMQILNDSIYYNDGELYHSNSVALNIMFNQIRKDGTIVVMGGEGADEVFRGYSSNVKLNFANYFGRYPLTKILKRINPSKLFLLDIFNDYKKGIALFSSNFFTPERADLLMKIKGEIHPDRQKVFDQIERMKPGNAITYYDQKVYLSGLLRRIDRSSMKNYIEARVPFLDYRLVEELNKIEFHKKSGILHKYDKKILKKIAQSYIPSEIIYRRKEGFGSPIETYRNKLTQRISNYYPDFKANNIDELWMINTIVDYEKQNINK